MEVDGTPISEDEEFILSKQGGELHFHERKPTERERERNTNSYRDPSAFAEG